MVYSYSSYLVLFNSIIMGSFWFVYDVILVAVLIWQLIYTYKKMKTEENIDMDDNNAN